MTQVRNLNYPEFPNFEIKNILLRLPPGSIVELHLHGDNRVVLGMLNDLIFSPIVPEGQKPPPGSEARAIRLVTSLRVNDLSLPALEVVPLNHIRTFKYVKAAPDKTFEVLS